MGQLGRPWNAGTAHIVRPIWLLLAIAIANWVLPYEMQGLGQEDKHRVAVPVGPYDLRSESNTTSTCIDHQVFLARVVGVKACCRGQISSLSTTPPFPPLNSSAFKLLDNSIFIPEVHLLEGLIPTYICIIICLRRPQRHLFHGFSWPKLGALIMFGSCLVIKF